MPIWRRLPGSGVLRVKRAAEELLSSKDKVAEIGFGSGF